MVTSQENLKLILKELKLKDLDDLYFSIGSYKYTVTHIVNIIIPKEETSAIKKNINIKSGSDILIDGKVNILTHLAKCCNPVKGWYISASKKL